MKKLIVFLFLCSLAAFGQGSRFGDSTPAFTSGSVPGTPGIFIQAMPDTLVSICTHPANAVPCTNKATTYTDLSLGTSCPSNQQVVLAGTNACVSTTDGQGNWGAYAASGNYDYTLTYKGFSFGPYTVSVGGSGGTNLLPANNNFTGTNTFPNINGIRVVDGTHFTTCAAAVADLGSSTGIVEIPTGYSGPACPSVPANVTIWDFTGGDPSALNTCAWNSTSGSGLHAMLRCTQTRTSPTSSDLSGYFVNVLTGNFANNQSLDAVSPEIDVIGTVNSPTNTALQASENAIAVESTGGNLPFLRGGIGYVNSVNGSTTTVGEVDGYEGLGCNSILGAAVSKCYGVVGDNQTAGTSENYSMFGRGDWKAVNGHQFDVTDNGGTPRHTIQWRSDNTIQYFPLVDGSTGWRWSRQDAGADYLLINTNGVSIPTQKFSASGIVDFSSSTNLKLPVFASFASTANGQVGYDSTNNNWHFWVNGADHLMVPLAAGFNTGDCAQPTNSGGTWFLADTGSPCGSGGSGATLQTNTVNNTSQVLLNFTNTAGAGGITFSNPSGGVESATLNNTTTTVNSQSCALGGSCTIPHQTGGVNNTSQAGINFITSTVNATGLTATHSNPATNQEKVEITGTVNPASGGLGINASASTGVVQDAAGTMSVSTALANGTTATTQTNGDSTTKVATDAFVLNNSVANPLTTLGDLPYGGASGAFTRLAGPTATNGVPQTLISIPSGGLATAPQWSPAGIGVNTQTGTSYTIAATDRASLVIGGNASSQSYTVPQAGSTGFGNNIPFALCNSGAGTINANPVTSLVNIFSLTTYTPGQSSLALSNGQCSFWYSDNTNYDAILFGANSGGATVHLDNLSAVSINSPLLFQSAKDLGSATAPPQNIWFYGGGTQGSTSMKITGTPTGNRVFTFPDATTGIVGESATDNTTTHVLHASATNQIGTFSALTKSDQVSTTVYNDQANTYSTGLQSFSAADLLQPVHSSDPGTCTAGQIEFNSTGGVMKFCSAANTWTALGSAGTTAFSAISTATNTTATMTCGAGCTITTTSTGVNNANQVNGATIPASKTVLGSNSSSQLVDNSSSVCVPGSFSAQTDSATVTWAIGSVPCSNASLTFTVHSGSRTLNLTGLVNGGSYVIWLKQDATGGEGLTLGTGCTWKVINGGSGAITLSSSANAIDVLAFTYDGTNCYATLGKNYN